MTILQLIMQGFSYQRGYGVRIIRILLGPLKPELLFVDGLSQRRRWSEGVAFFINCILGVILGHDLVGRDLIWNDGRHLVNVAYAHEADI